MDTFDELVMTYRVIQTITDYFIEHESMTRGKWLDFMEDHMEKVSVKSEEAA